MHLKYLSLCLFSFGLFGCSQHLVQETKKSNQPLDQRAINGLNAIYETPSFDFKGQVLIKNTPSSIKISSAPRAAKQNGQLDDEIKKQIDFVLKSQNIKLSAQDKKELYRSLAEQSDPYGYISSYGSGESSSTRFITGLLNFLNSFEFSYDGSVHYRQKMATLNLNFQYEKPTLFVKTTIPMAVDFNQYKFYMNYFSLVPYLVNPEHQDTMAYLDFSKYKNVGDKFNFKELLVYAKQLNAVNFLLAEQNNLQSVAVSQAEKQNGTVDKIRLKTNFIDLFYQNMLFDYVNEPYVFEKILGQQWKESDEEIEVDEVDQVNASSSIYDDIEDQYDNVAIKSAERVFTFISQNLIYSEDDEYDVPEAEAEDTYADSEVEAEEYLPDSELVVASEVYADNTRYDEGDDEYDIEVESADLSEQGCQALLTSKEKIPVGFIGLCRYEYDIDLLSAKNGQGSEDKYEELEGFVSQLEQLQAIFKPYRTVELTDVYAFKKIWDKHQPEIQKILKAKDNVFFSVPLQVDVSLDKQGRAQSIVYDAVKSDLKYGKTHISSTTQFLNYGKATAINTSKLKNAKSIEEVSKGSLLERLFSGISAKLGPDGDIVDQEDLEELETSNAKIKQVVLDTYLNTGSYLKAYQAAFAMFYASQRPDQFKYYSANDINEIAELSAYKFSSELDEPKGTNAKRLDKLAEKHQLIRPHNFDSIGYLVANFVDTTIESEKDEKYWKKLKQKYTTKQAAFAAHYEKLFKDRYDISKNEELLLTQASKIMSQSYVDDANGKLSKKTIQNLKPDHEELIDREIYYQTYRDMIEHYKK